jgi:hypothetical protein
MEFCKKSYIQTQQAAISYLQGLKLVKHFSFSVVIARASKIHSFVPILSLLEFDQGAVFNSMALELSQIVLARLIMLFCL